MVSLLRGDNAILHLTREASYLAISVITHIEFLAFPHIAKEDVELFHAFLARVDVMNITHQDARLITAAIELRRTYSLKLPDAVIVASVLSKDAILVTADRKLLSLAGRVTGLRIHPLDSITQHTRDRCADIVRSKSRLRWQDVVQRNGAEPPAGD